MTEVVTNTAQEQEKTFSLQRQESGVAHLVMDVKTDSMNTLKAEFADEIAQVLKEIRQDDAIVGLVLVSGKADSFVAGADVHMLANCNSAAEATALSRQGQMIFDQLENLTIPVVAAVHGACLGGGLELAMACHAIVCSDSSKTTLGLPEVQLGLLPGGGGTQRLPKRVGLQKALDMMLTGKQLRAKQALKAGLVTDVVPNSILVATAEKLALSGKVKPKARKVSLMAKLLEGNSIGRSILFTQATKAVLSQTKGNYPAPLKIIDCVRAGVEQAPSKGYQVEADHFGQLVMSDVSAQLRQVFFATTDMKKEQGVEGVVPEKINNVAVLGGGLMGGGIAFVTATKAKLPVRIKDISHQGISAAMKYGYDILHKKVKRRFMRHSEMQSQLALITGTTEYQGFKQADMVVEAVFEDLALKQNMVLEIESHCQEQTIFASNTSSLPIGKIAEKALRPENVIGLHYFSPVDKMPLVEIIPHEKTSDQTISTTVAFAKKQGKTPIVVKDKAGFYVNRILAPYMNEAAILLLEGCSIEALDKAMVNFGFPVGPMQLLDEVGIDIGAKIGPILQADLGERFAPPAAFAKLIDDGRLGKKNQKGFYQYKSKSKKKLVDESVYGVLGLTVSNTSVTEAQVERCIYMMLNEAARCLDEDIIRNARDGDIGAIFGIGFPPFLGGPFQYMDKIGAATLVSKLTQWQAEFGERFTPADVLIKMAEHGESFYNA
ncbi:3-hydroxyacyl-CoA dehydrogenase / enoyl-CoA hydratase / 3-hydroxybutyryl-CoA epimerase [Colwellia chukchiensis]|uniref:enoyl-CoA hydratase n=1 Tax=Colwellia chukchiensis TaxID=641665 RepID=A0A1H7H4M4_9GAMM|nr:fatty acid oxidation complex subunit alpha FadJ [Colwellia chukchiensis]SEK45363.1 3-hydroxyacyl-CoA dehydrogenase / enoyl-CoA hydratase / 3-hydroxybutyryl-CoA epimerase [Colwellia chukchiensis]